MKCCFSRTLKVNYKNMFANRTLNAILWFGYFEMNFPMEFIDKKKIQSVIS